MYVLRIPVGRDDIPCVTRPAGKPAQRIVRPRNYISNHSIAGSDVGTNTPVSSRSALSALRCLWRSKPAMENSEPTDTKKEGEVGTKRMVKKMLFRRG